jgi:hypothetical protein
MQWLRHCFLKIALNTEAKNPACSVGADEEGVELRLVPCSA